MTKYLTYLLDAFGYSSIQELNQSCWHIGNKTIANLTIGMSISLGAVSMVLQNVTGFDPVTLWAFAGLIVMETISGIQVALKNGGKFSSRKFGRMFLKLGYYLGIIVVLHRFSTLTNFAQIAGVEMDPFLWLYHAFSVAIVFQLIVSLLENLGRLGFKESKSIGGVILKKFNKWFDLDNDPDDPNNPRP